MLYPQSNYCRSVFELSGFWEVKVDKDHIGEEKEWMNGFKSDGYIGVPGSWNEQLAEMGLMNYVGSLWYQRRFCPPAALSNKKMILRFGSADFSAKVWVNGKYLGEHNGGYLPFEFDISDFVNKGKDNLLVVCVDNTLSHDTIPQGVCEEDYVEFKKRRDQTYPPTVFDFFTYGGLHRPVKLLFLNKFHLQEVEIETRIDGKIGKLKFNANYSQAAKPAKVRVTLLDGSREIAELAGSSADSMFDGEFTIAKCHFWSPQSPYLYTLCFELFDGDELLDEYKLEVGVREVEVRAKQLLLNGKPIFLKGFGKHEDFAVVGKGLCYPLIVKDFQLMKWIGANSFRTSHYPYAEEIMQMADRMGFLVIDEVPAVSLNFKYVTQKTLTAHKRALTELITRDRNHPSVICWSVANEPGIWGEDEAVSEKAKNYWKEIFGHVRSLEPSRPVTIPACIELGDKDPGFRYSDILSINRYWGWYDGPGEIEKAGAELKAELEALYEKYGKPIFVSEFGADTIEGEHATYPQLFTEEYQTSLIEKYFEIIESLPFTVGEHIWNFADFRTAQHCRRVILNRKGVFNRQREPKSAAFAIRKHWISE